MKKREHSRGGVKTLLLLIPGAILLGLLAFQPVDQPERHRAGAVSVAGELPEELAVRISGIKMPDPQPVETEPQQTIPAETQPEAAVPEQPTEPPAETAKTIRETTEPETTAPETTEPETTAPETTEPETTEPETTEPETTEPETTEPETTELETTEPETTEPETTEPETTEPETTEPETTEPETTEPETTEPETTEPPTEPPTEPEVIKKHYVIEDNIAAAPVPNQSCYGEVESAADMQPILELAGDVLEGQNLYFSTDKELLDGSTVHYYLDETIFAVLWKQKIQNCVYTFAEVKVMDPSQFRRYLTGGKFASGKLMLTSEMAATVNAVVATSADFYAYRTEGLAVFDGIAEKAKPGVKDSLFVDWDGNFLPLQNYVFSGVQELQDYVDEHNINFSLSFGPVIVKDGEFVCPKDYRPGEVRGQFPRAAVCQMDRLHYLSIVANKEQVAPRMLTMAEFSQTVMETGCIQAYALDGGQTATVVMNNEVRNHVNYGSERRVSDILYYATAIPGEEGVS